MRSLHLTTLCALAVIVGASLEAQAADPARGKRLYETHCGGCHYERLHDRPRERSLVHSIADLRAQVALRAGATNRPFTAEDLADLVEYLDRSHYRLAQ